MRLLVVTPSTSYRVGDFLAAAHALGCEVVVATDVSSAIPGASVAVAFDDPRAAAAELVSVLGAVDGVVGTDGPAPAVAAEVAALLALPGNPPDAMAAAADKLAQRRAAARAGVPQPHFELLDDDTEWSTYPAVVKPVDRAASQGVLRVNGPEEFAEARVTVGRIVGGGPLIVESYVPGKEVAVEGLLRDGQLDVLALFDKPDTPTGPTFPETLLVAPARLDADGRRRVVAVAEAVLAALGLVEGPVHVEVKVDGTDVWFLELAARTIGGLCSRSLDRDGIRLEARVIAHALSLPRPPDSEGMSPSDPSVAIVGTGNGTGVLMLPVTATGTVRAVRGEAAARAVPGITDVVVSVRAGQHVTALPAGDRYLGFVFARAGTADAVEAALRVAWAAIKVDITAS